jgi:hypothetical protein
MDPLHTSLKHGKTKEWNQQKGRWECPNPEDHMGHNAKDRRERPAPHRGLI